MTATLLVIDVVVVVMTGCWIYRGLVFVMCRVAVLILCASMCASMHCVQKQ